MRIALVTDTFYPATDGATTTVKAIADRLIETGHDVRFVAPGPGLPRYNRSRVVRVDPRARAGAQVRDALAGFEPDLVHVVEPGRLGRTALKHARVLGLRTVVVQQGPIPEASVERWRSRAADRADHLVVTARWMVERLAGLGVEAALWLPGVDGAAFAPSLRDRWLADKWGLADAVAAVAADPQRALLGQRGRELALTRSWRDAVDKLVAPYVLAAAGVPRKPIRVS